MGLLTAVNRPAIEKQLHRAPTRGDLGGRGASPLAAALAYTSIIEAGSVPPRLAGTKVTRSTSAVSGIIIQPAVSR